jgi:hypothetical protein
VDMVLRPAGLLRRGSKDSDVRPCPDQLRPVKADDPAHGRIKAEGPGLCTGAHGDSPREGTDQAGDLWVTQPQPYRKIIRRSRAGSASDQVRGREVQVLPSRYAEVHGLDGSPTSPRYLA